MILVDRGGVPAPAVLTDAGGPGLAEAAKAAQSIAEWKGPRSTWKYEFRAYSNVLVKEALTALFHGKCAYCESYYGATAPMDVEHWRPKGRVEDVPKPRKPAYYWLASTWDNLLPSCIDCNRRRKQKDALTGEEVLQGKEDQFPLEDGSPRAAAPGEEVREVPLLINPCVDDPTRFLEFTADGVVRPVETTGLDNRRARASLTTYALNRSGLVHSRREHLRTIQLRFAKVTSLVRLLEGDLDDGTALAIEELLLDELRELARMRRADQPYSQQACQLIDRWMADYQLAGIPSGALETPEVPGPAGPAAAGTG